MSMCECKKRAIACDGRVAHTIIGLANIIGRYNNNNLKQEKAESHIICTAAKKWE